MSVCSFDTMNASADSLGLCSEFSGRSRMNKRLRFGSVEIKDMPIVLGDNTPSDGAPITIGWKAESTRYTNVDLLELCKCEDRRGEASLRLSAEERVAMLLQAGHSAEEIANAWEMAKESRAQRDASLRQQKWEFINSASRKMKKLVKFTSSNKPNESRSRAA